ncbi:ABC transporter G family member protein, putative [Babesia ovata]|uniref:ABC transporter G family member protein, putative n=1 Tax=Babesia ovata TaxID=189622 RepID=A0A2H6KDV3_9APIC|nr:ABC transporter G family member protein, putative [Babesia ovata]GBE61171.1 ABC transporter G family member protein, putative [Babesia ovata]
MKLVADLSHCRGERAEDQFSGGLFATILLVAIIALADAALNLSDELPLLQRDILYTLDCLFCATIQFFIKRVGEPIAKLLDSFYIFSNAAADDINILESVCGYTNNICFKLLFHSNCEVLDITVLPRLIKLLLHIEYPPHGAVVPQDCGFQPALHDIRESISTKGLRIIMHLTLNTIQA